MFYCVHMVMFDLVDSLYASLSGAVLSRGSEWSLSWDIGSAGSFFFFSLYQSQDLSLFAWTLHVILNGGLSTVTARLLTQRLNI